MRKTPRAEQNLVGLIRREAPVRSMMGTVIDSADDGTVLVRLPGETTVKCRASVGMTLEYGMQVLVLRVHGSMMPVIVAAVRRDGERFGSALAGSGTQLVFPTVTTFGIAGAIVVVWNTYYPYNAAFVVQISPDSSADTAEQILVTGGTYYVHQAGDNQVMYFQVSALRADEDGLTQSGWSPWVSGAALYSMANVWDSLDWEMTAHALLGG